MFAIRINGFYVVTVLEARYATEEEAQRKIDMMIVANHSPMFHSREIVPVEALS